MMPPDDPDPAEASDPLVWAPPGATRPDPAPVGPQDEGASGVDGPSRLPLAVIGAVLVGGASRRMGTTKALLDLDGQPMARHVAEALQAGGAHRVIYVGSDPQVFDSLWSEGVMDLWPGSGPLAGIATAVLEARRAATGGAGWVPDSLPDEQVAIVVAACDQPDLSPELIARLVDALRHAPLDHVAAVPQTPEGRRHPMPTAWRGSAGPMLQSLVESGARRADAGFAVAEHVTVAASRSELRDVDSPTDLKARRERGALPRPLLAPPTNGLPPAP